MLSPIVLKFFNQVLKIIGSAAQGLKKRISGSYEGYKALKGIGMGENGENANALYNESLLDFEYNHVKHPLLIKLFSEKTAREAFINEYYNNSNDAFKNDLETNLNVRSKYNDLKNSKIDLGNEIAEFRSVFESRVQSSQSVHQISLVKEISKYIGTGIQVSEQSIDLSTYISEISSLRSQNKHGAVLSLLERFKEARWDKLPLEIKFKVTLHFGITYFEIDNKKEAAKYFIELLNYQINLGDAISYAALGFSLIGNYESAVKYANDALQINNRNENAYLALFFSNWNTLKAEDIDKLIPPEIQTLPGIAINIAMLKEKEGQYDEAFDIASKIDRDHQVIDSFKIDLSIYLASNRINSVESKDDFIFNQLDDDAINSIKYAHDKFEEIWNKIKNTDLQESRSYVLTNKGVTNKMLADPKKAEQDFRASLNIRKTYFTYRHLLILKDEVPSEYDLILKEIEAIELSNSEKQELQIFKANREIRNGKSEEILKEFIDELPNVKDKEIYEKYISVIADIYLKTGNLVESEKYIMESVQKFPEDPFGYFFLFRIFELKGDLEKAFQYLKKAQELISEKSARIIALTIAEVYIKYQNFDAVVDILRKVANVKKPSILTKKLLGAFFQSGRFNDALTLLKPLRHKFPKDAFLVDIESSIFESMTKYDESIASLQDYIRLVPEDKLLTVKLAINFYKKNDYPSAKELLDTISDFESLPIDIQFAIADTYIKSHQYEKGQEIAYSIRQKNFNNPMVHHKYLQLQVGAGDKGHEYYFPPKIIENCHVVLINENGKHIDYILVSSPRYANEISINENLSKLLIGKSVDNVVEIGEELFRVNSIMTKYTFAYHDSMDQISSRLLDGPVRVMRLKQEGTPEERLSPFFKTISDRQEADKNVLKFYQDGQITLGACASMCGESPIRYWQRLSQNPDIGIIATGTSFENSMALNLLLQSSPVVLDITAILSLFSVELLHLMKNLPNEFYVCESTIEHIEQEIKGLESDIDKDSFFVNKIGSEFVKVVVTPADKKHEIEKWKSILSNINDFARKIMPNADNNFLQKKERDRILGKSFNETALIASQKGAIILSDDFYFRGLVFTEQKAIGCSCINLLPYLQEKGIITKESIHTYLEKYIGLNYRFVPVNEGILFNCFVKSNFLVQQPFVNAGDVIHPQYLDNLQAVRLVGNFFYEIYRQTSLSSARTFAVEFVLKKLYNGRNQIEIKRLLIPYLYLRFQLLPIDLAGLLQIIQN
jgi:tetratricopeptide (TPR) repeat protein